MFKLFIINGRLFVPLKNTSTFLSLFGSQFLPISFDNFPDGHLEFFNFRTRHLTRWMCHGQALELVFISAR